MRALVVYESMFGNTRDIAEAVAVGLSLRGVDVEVTEVGDLPVPAHLDVDLLVVGAPTHTFTLSREETRTAAREHAEDLVSTGRLMRDWLAELPADLPLPVAAFDTHADRRLPGGASKALRRRLRRLGYRLVLPAESFLVGDMTGPLLEGETERARGWGARLASAIATPASSGEPTADAGH